MRTNSIKLQERQRIRKHIKWKEPFTRLLWSIVRKKQLVGMRFRCEAPLRRIKGREIRATFFCSKYHFVLEPLTGPYTDELKEQDRFLYERGFYVHRIRITNDKLEILSELLGIFRDYKKWKKELGIYLHTKNHPVTCDDELRASTLSERPI